MPDLQSLKNRLVRVRFQLVSQLVGAGPLLLYLVLYAVNEGAGDGRITGLSSLGPPPVPATASIISHAPSVEYSGVARLNPAILNSESPGRTLLIHLLILITQFFFELSDPPSIILRSFQHPLAFLEELTSISVINRQHESQERYA